MGLYGIMPGGATTSPKHSVTVRMGGWVSGWCVGGCVGGWMGGCVVVCMCVRACVNVPLPPALTLAFFIAVIAYGVVNGIPLLSGGDRSPRCRLTGEG